MDAELIKTVREQSKFTIPRVYSFPGGDIQMYPIQGYHVLNRFGIRVEIGHKPWWRTLVQWYNARMDAASWNGRPYNLYNTAIIGSGLFAAYSAYYLVRMLRIGASKGLDGLSARLASATPIQQP